MRTNDAGGGGFVTTQIEVDIRGLQDFATLIQGELDANLRPNKDQIVAEHSRGVGFGLRHASTDMHLAVSKYYECLTAAVSNLEAYIQASELLIAAAHKVSAAYQSAEELSGARLTDVETAFRQAVAEANAIQSAADQRALEQRIARMERQGLL
jgi:hypothetical protein